MSLAITLRTCMHVSDSAGPRGGAGVLAASIVFIFSFLFFSFLFFSFLFFSFLFFYLH